MNGSFIIQKCPSTYQRLVDPIFEGQIGRNLDAYVDDMAIKSKMEQDFLKDIEETLMASKRAQKTELCSDENWPLHWYMPARRLRRYFQGHGIKARIPNKGAPNSKAVPNPKEASESSKGKEEQIIPDPQTKADVWKLYTDGASSDYGSGAGLILIDLEGVEYSYALRLNFNNSNNDAKYESLLAGLRIATGMKVKNIQAVMDSKLVASQVKGSYEA
ncbi:reverse transcriptase domain-containing protein [Tanacetum coccineum]